MPAWRAPPSGSDSVASPGRRTRSVCATAGSPSVVRRCQELPGQELFQYVDEAGDVRDIASDDVNAYLREASGGDFTAKDFRTWAGTVLAYRALRALQPGDDERTAQRNVVEAIRKTAGALGNTPAVARRSYVHPAVLEAYLDGAIARRPRRGRRGADDPADGDDARRGGRGRGPAAPAARCGRRSSRVAPDADRRRSG